jgi:hypothetical protein
MATLWVDGDTGPMLRDWLQADWAILFSHPSDFEYQGLENDRWLSILRCEFDARAVRALALQRAGADAVAGWTHDLSGERCLVRLGRVDAPSRALREQILAMPSRFALIIDAQLRSRGVLKYRAGRASVSPLDLLGSIDALRRRRALRIAA